MSTLAGMSSFLDYYYFYLKLDYNGYWFENFKALTKIKEKIIKK